VVRCDRNRRWNGQDWQHGWEKKELTGRALVSMTVKRKGTTGKRHMP
jgi:hypothetical protein